MTDFVIDVIIDPSSATAGSDKIDRRLRRLEKSGRALQKTLRRALTLVGVVAAARQLGIFADSLTNVRNRLRIVTKGTAQLNAVTQKLFDIAVKTRTGFAATSTIFARTALAVKDLGLSLQETLNFTEALNKAIVLSGSGAQEANNALIQLSQGLSIGQLRGDELRSVLEQLPLVADLIAEELGVLRGELKLLGEQGKITTKDIINAFSAIPAAKLTEAFSKSVPTLSQGFSVLTTQLIRYIGQVDDSFKISERLARTLIRLGANLETVGKLAVVAGAALAGPFAKAGVLFAAGAVRALTVAILANPIGALIIVAVAAVAAIIQFGDSISVSEDGLVSLKDTALATWKVILDSIQPVVDVITEGFAIAINFVIDAFSSLNVTFEDVLKFVKTFVNRFLGFFFGLNRAMFSIFNDLKLIFKDVLGEDLTKLIKSAVEFATEGLKIVAKLAGTILDSLNDIASELNATIDAVDPSDKTFAGTFATVGKNAKDAFVKGFNADFVGDLVDAVAPALKKINEEARKISTTRLTPNTPLKDAGLDEKGVASTALPFALREQLRLLELEAKNLKLANKERGIQNELLELEEKLRSSNVSLTDTTRGLLEVEVRRLTALRDQADVLDDLKGPQEEINTRQEALNALYDRGAISLVQFTAQMKGLALAQAELNIAAAGDLFPEGFSSSFDEIGEGFSAAGDLFFDGFSLGIDEMLDKVGFFVATAGELFGQFFADASAGFADAIGNALVFGDSIAEAIGGAARSALASLLSGLIDIGIQFVLNALLTDKLVQKQVAGSTVAATADATAQALKTTAAVASIGVITTAVVASNAAVAISAAPAAALVSLASFGANSVPATAGILATTAVAEGVAATAFLADGGFVSGPGSPTSDSIPARLSDGEFVVSARATARFRPQLEAINNGAANDEVFSNSSRASSQSGSAEGGSGVSSVNIVNVIDPSIVEDFLDTPGGEKVIVNVIERNAATINTLLAS